MTIPTVSIFRAVLKCPVSTTSEVTVFTQYSTVSPITAVAKIRDEFKTRFPALPWAVVEDSVVTTEFTTESPDRLTIVEVPHRAYC